MRGRKITKEITDLRLNALQRWLDANKHSRRWLMKKFAPPISQGAVQGWIKTDKWPEWATEQIEKICDLPSGFFSRIAAGMSYEQALNIQEEQVLGPQSSSLRQDIETFLDMSEDEVPDIFERWQQLGLIVALMLKDAERQKLDASVKKRQTSEVSKNGEEKKPAEKTYNN